MSNNKTFLNNSGIIFGKDQVEYIRKTIQTLNPDKAPQNSEEILNYFRYYDIDFEVNAHFFGYYISDEKRIATHIYLNNNSKGIVLLIHGYLEHSAITFTKLIPALLKNGYSVAAIDLSGHGFSDGRRGDSKDFTEYYLAIKEFYNHYLYKFPKPYYILGHSTGCVGILKALYDDTIKFNAYILAAPLIRSDSWTLSKLGMVLFGWYLPKVPTLKKRGTSNSAYAKFLSNDDPLFVRWTPTSWVRTLYNWEKNIRNYETNNREIIILQGKKDKTVDWEYNIKFIETRFPNSEVKYFPEANHTLFAEPEHIRSEVIDAVLDYLDR